MGNRPILSDMILRFLGLVHSVMARLLFFLLISTRLGQCEVLVPVYILGVVASFPSVGVDLVLKCMVFVNDVDQTAASRARPIMGFRSSSNFSKVTICMWRVARL